MTNGNEILGKIVDETDSQVVIDTDDGTLTVNRENATIMDHSDAALDQIGAIRSKNGNIYVKAEINLWRLLQRQPNNHPEPVLPDRFISDTRSMTDIPELTELISGSDASTNVTEDAHLFALPSDGTVKLQATERASVE